MKMTKLSLCVATLALGVASAASSYSIHLSSDVQAGATQLKAGDYKVQVQGNQAIFKQGKNTIQLPVAVETGNNTYRYTSMDADSGTLQSISLEGTKTKLVFTAAPPSGATSAAQ